MSFVTITGLAKQFGQSPVFENIDCRIEQGELITLLGPSGCGKSTLLRCIAGLTEIDAGEIYVDGQEISRVKPRDRNISMVFQSYALFPNMTVAENIGFGLKMNKTPKPEIDAKVKRFLGLVQLEEKANCYPKQLSGGQQQRVALARALVVEPKILLLDEPLSALDAKIRKALRLQIREIQRELNITTIFVTHDQEEALIMSDRIFLMDKGRFAQIGTPEQIYTHPATEFAARFVGNYNVFAKKDLAQYDLSGLDGEIFALRPESIYLGQAAAAAAGSGPGLLLEGMIADSIVLGNVLRFYVKVVGYTFLVDILNRGSQDFHPTGTTVPLFIPQDECKKLQTAS